MKPGTIFTSGTAVNSPSGIYLSDHRLGKEIHWVAVRGGIHDWAIYFARKDKGYTPELIAKLGDKIYLEEHIKSLVPCTDKAFQMYRY